MSLRDHLLTQPHDDPADYVNANVPGMGDSFRAIFAQNVEAPNGAVRPATDADRIAAAQDYALKQRMEQQRLGISDNQIRTIPQQYADDLKTQVETAASSEDPQSRLGVVTRLRAEAQLWGGNWNDVWRQIAGKGSPVVTVIAAWSDWDRLRSSARPNPPRTAPKTRSRLHDNNACLRPCMRCPPCTSHSRCLA